MRIVPTRHTALRPSVEQQPAEIFVPATRPASDGERPTPVPRPRPHPALPATVPAPPAAREPDEPPRTLRPEGLLAAAVAAMLLSGLLGVATIGPLPGDSVPLPSISSDPADPVPPVAPQVPFGDSGESAYGETYSDTGGDTSGDTSGDTGGDRITVTAVPSGTTVALPSPGSRDWVAPGADGTGARVRADLAQESIEFRAADTQPGLPGPFPLVWSGAHDPVERGSASTILGVRPGGRVEFVFRPLAADGELVVHLGGDGVTVTLTTPTGSTHEVLSAAAAAVTVPLPAATPVTVTISPSGDQMVGVACAELR